MRILLLDIDSLRPDRLGCYGYHRNTSPTIDAIAAAGARCEQVIASDVPCCPSRSSLFAGRYGYRHGCVSHEGQRAVRYADPERGFVDPRDRDTLPALLRAHGHRTAFVSAFPTRHSAWHSLAGFHDWIDTGANGHEIAPTVHAAADAWLEAHGHESDWFCHVTFWDVHTPYRTPDDYGDPFADQPGPVWPHADAVSQHATSPGVRSARDCAWSKGGGGPRQPDEVTNLDELARFQNGYDTAIRYVDDHIAKLMTRLEQLGIRDDTAIIITADHGEDMGEHAAYGSHCFCGPAVARVPLIMRWPGAQPAVLTGLHQHFDLSATVLERCGIAIPDTWDARSLATTWDGDDHTAGRPYAVSSMLAQGIQRAVYWQQTPGAPPTTWLRTWNNLKHPLPDECWFTADDRWSEAPQTDARELTIGRTHYHHWLTRMAARSAHPDPLDTVVKHGTGPTHLAASDRYHQRLATTGRV